MYERSNPYEEFFAGGKLDMTHCVYEQLDDRTTRVTGSRFLPDARVRVKLEGSGKVGERYVGLCGIRDPYTVANVDRVIAWAREQVRARFGDTGYLAFPPQGFSLRQKLVALPAEGRRVSPRRWKGAVDEIRPLPAR
jgi:hypothetical protein